MGGRSKHVSPEDLAEMASLKHWGAPPEQAKADTIKRNAVADCGWGRLIFGQTFEDSEDLAAELRREARDERDVAFYVREPHVVLAHAPQALFLDPSHTFRLNLELVQDGEEPPHGVGIRDAKLDDEKMINAIYQSHGMVPLREGYLASRGLDSPVTVLVAEDVRTHELVGVVIGVDHVRSFNDPDNGSSLWALGVDLRTPFAGVGSALVIALAKRFKAAGRSFMDLSVMYDNEQAIQLYRKLGFEQIPVYCLKKKNPFNEPLFIGPAPEEQLNIYAQIIVDEARRRGIAVEIEDAEAGLFTLTFGGRSISCRESLSDLTSAVAMSRCMDKSLTQRLLRRHGLTVPAQITVGSHDEARSFLAQHKRVVVKPAEGEQGRGVFVDLTSEDAVKSAIREAGAVSDSVLMEQFVEGEDLRIIVINREVVAAAIRRPATITGNGKDTIAVRIEKRSRRRAAATGGESRIPMDEETTRCVAAAGYELNDVLPEGVELVVRKTANLHTGGTIHDVTPELHPELGRVALRAAEILDMPVVGLDLMVPDHTKSAYYIIEANERPGLANHEPQPTAEKFVDFLFPQTAIKELSCEQ